MSRLFGRNAIQMRLTAAVFGSREALFHPVIRAAVAEHGGRGLYIDAALQGRRGNAAPKVVMK